MTREDIQAVLDGLPELDVSGFWDRRRINMKKNRGLFRSDIEQMLNKTQECTLACEYLECFTRARVEMSRSRSKRSMANNCTEFRFKMQAETGISISSYLFIVAAFHLGFEVRRYSGSSCAHIGISTACWADYPRLPPNWESRWGTDEARGILARYRETNDLSIMPIFADALENAGCINRPLLLTLRRPEEMDEMRRNADYIKRVFAAHSRHMRSL